MALVTYADGTIREYISGETKLVLWVSPATMDSNDTVVLPTITGRTPTVIQCKDLDDDTVATATLSTQTVTIDAAGGTTDHQYTLLFSYF